MARAPQPYGGHVTALEYLQQILIPALSWFHKVVPSIPASEAEQLMLTVIPGQESDWSNVQQANGGIARGFYQQQQNNLDDILSNRATDAKAIMVCTTLGVQPTAAAVYAALLGNTKLQVAFARLGLWADPEPLPAVGDELAAWDTYLRCWRPGAPARARWAEVYPQALAAIQQGTQTV